MTVTGEPVSVKDSVSVPSILFPFSSTGVFSLIRLIDCFDSVSLVD